MHINGKAGAGDKLRARLELAGAVVGVELLLRAGRDVVEPRNALLVHARNKVARERTVVPDLQRIELELAILTWVIKRPSVMVDCEDIGVVGLLEGSRAYWIAQIAVKDKCRLVDREEMFP